MWLLIVPCFDVAAAVLGGASARNTNLEGEKCKNQQKSIRTS